MAIDDAELNEHGVAVTLRCGVRSMCRDSQRDSQPAIRDRF
jgi:hypothetical protein